MRTVSCIGAFLGGVLVGGLVGLLVAPQKGQETRNKINDTIDVFCKKHDLKLSKKDVDDLVDDIKDAAADIVD